jgi:hypothetical protein
MKRRTKRKFKSRNVVLPTDVSPLQLALDRHPTDQIIIYARVGNENQIDRNTLKSERNEE